MELRSRKCGSKISRSRSISPKRQMQNFLDFVAAQQLAHRSLQDGSLMEPDDPLRILAHGRQVVAHQENGQPLLLVDGAEHLHDGLAGPQAPMSATSKLERR